MNRIQHIICCASVAMMTTAFQPVSAQINLAKDTYPVIVAPHNQTVSFRERTLCYEITANVPFEVTTEGADWVSVRKMDDGTVYIHLKENLTEKPRTAQVKFVNAESNLNEVLTLTQGRNEVIEDLTQDTQVAVASATDNGHNGNDGVDKTLDNNVSTLYHTSYAGDLSAENPAILTYNFKDVAHIDYIEYVARPQGINGNFKEVEVLAKCGSESEYKTITKVDLGGAGGTSRIDLGKEGLNNPTSIQLKVTSGASDQGGKMFASCAEMRFMVDNRKELFTHLFADEALTTLKSDIKQADIDKIEDSYIRNLAQALLDGTYKKDYRIAEYKAKLSTDKQAEIFGTPGKSYDRIQGVTGVNIRKGKQGIAVSGLKEGERLPMHIIAWYQGKTKGIDDPDGAGPHELSYTLMNGFNEIDYPLDHDGLAYICFYDDEPAKRQPVKVHFINGEVNGYLSPDKTNAEMDSLLKYAPNPCMDVVGSKVHSIWTSRGVLNHKNGQKISQGLYGNCKAEDGTKGYRQFMNVLDSLVTWEHNLLGYTEYGLTPDNRTTAYVNFTYYMFQGYHGVSFMVDQEPRVLNCKNLIYDDDDAIWGLSHEWGHLHQMHPYFCWAGMSEVTNNMNSYYNVMRMGHTKSDKIDAWPLARKHFVEGYYGSFNYNTVKFDRATGKVVTKGTHKADALYTKSTQRHLAYTCNEEVAYNKEFQDLALEMKDSIIYRPNVNKDRALGITEVGVGETLCPYIMLYNFFSRGNEKFGVKADPEFAPHWYESLRQNDNENGSQIEKKGKADKYELIASAQNGNKNNKYAELKSRFPNSVWVTRNYVTPNSTMWGNSAPYIFNYVRKVSRLTGYNLFPYFETWGFFRVTALRIGDYGNKWTVLTKPMYDEFKADMDQLVKDGELKEMPEGMVEAISNAPDWFQNTPVFPN